MKTSLLMMLTIALSLNSFAKDQDIRSQIGPTVHAPITYKGNLYFLSTTGGLYKSKDKLQTAKLIGKAEKVTVSPLNLDGDFLYFGEGLHDSKKTSLYKFDLKQEKIVKQIPVEGHIQRAMAIDENSIFLGSGHDGFVSLDKELKPKWFIKKASGKSLHVDANPILYKDMVCFSSIYDYKGIICANKADGKIKFQIPLEENPKSELGLSGNLLYGMSTEADMMKTKFDIKSHLFVIDLDKGKLSQNKELRGYNFFKSPLVDKNKILVNLSTGDVIIIDLETTKVEYIGEFPEPFVSTPFVLNKSYCAVGIMGKILCYEKGKTQYHITKEKRLFESPVGTIKVIDGEAYVPSRMGFFTIR